MNCIISKTWFDHTEETVDEEEIKLINELKLIHGNKCVNIHVGGSGGFTLKHATDEHKRLVYDKIKKSNTGKRHSIETIEKMCISRKGELNSMYGKCQSDLCKAVNRMRMTENNPNKGKLGKLNHLYNAKLSEEHKAKISKAMSGENHPLYGKTGSLAPMFGKTHSNETKHKLSLLNKAVKRTGVIWELYNSGKLYNIWLSHNKPGRGGLSKILKSEYDIDVKPSSLQVVINYMQKVKNG